MMIFSACNDSSLSEKEQQVPMVLTLKSELVAKDYYDNMKTIAYATRAFDKESLSEMFKKMNIELPKTRTAGNSSIERVSYKDIPDNDSTVFINPIALDLYTLDIENEDTGETVNFFDLPLEQKMVFLDKLYLSDIEKLTKKLDLIPSLIPSVAQENKAVGELIASHQLEKMQVRENPISTRSANTMLKTIDAKSFFNKLNKITQEYESNMPETRGINIGGSHSNPTADIKNVMRMLINDSRIGDFILTLPVHGKSYVYLNVTSDYKVGHAGIITEHYSSPAIFNEQGGGVFGIGARTENGVTDEHISYWKRPCYVMGVQKARLKWKWRGFKSGLYWETTPVAPTPLAEWAEKYKGRKYVRLYEFVTAKWAAPSRFTCTTLVWWSAKKAYGLNLSGVGSTMVTPSRLLTDRYTYIRGEVRK